MAIRRVAREITAIHGKDKAVDCEAAARKVGKFIAGLSEVGRDVFHGFNYADTAAIARQAKADRERAAADRKAAKAGLAAAAE